MLAGITWQEMKDFKCRTEIFGKHDHVGRHNVARDGL